MKLHEPESWSDATFFSIGGVIGLLVGVGAFGLFEVGIGVAVAIIGGAALVGGLVAVALRDHLVGILIRWY